MSARFEIVRTEAEQPWHARVRVNGRITWRTENYSRMIGAEHAVLSFARMGATDAWGLRWNVEGVEKVFVRPNGTVPPFAPLVTYLDERTHRPLPTWPWNRGRHGSTAGRACQPGGRAEDRMKTICSTCLAELPTEAAANRHPKAAGHALIPLSAQQVEALERCAVTVNLDRGWRQRACGEPVVDGRLCEAHAAEKARLA